MVRTVLSTEGVVLVRFPTRLALTGSVLGLFAVSGGTVLTLGAPAARHAVPVPTFAPGVAVAAGSSASAPLVTGPPVTGEQLVALAAGPVTDRARAITAEERRAERARTEATRQTPAPQSAAPQDEYVAGFDRIRQKVEAACATGRLRGAFCTD